MFQSAATLNRIRMDILRSDISVTEQVIPAGPANEALLKKFAEEVYKTANPRVIPLGPSELLVRTLRDFYMVVPGWNLDVAPGIIRDGMIEAWTNEVFLSLLKEGDNIINVGANFGYYAVLGAQKVGRSGKVFAVEANPAVFPFLIKSSFWGGFPDVIRCFNCAAASPDMQNKKIDFMFDPQFIGGGNMFTRTERKVRPLDECLWSSENIEETLNEHRQFACGGVHSRVQATCRTIDSIVPTTEKVNVMLIDAEGSECFVIAGTKETIRRNPNVSIIMEWASCNLTSDPGRRPAIDAMWDFLLNEMHFNVFRICPEDYPGMGSMPKLERVNREQLYSPSLPHSDLLLTR
jgi:FkbM family methyltransferase